MITRHDLLTWLEGIDKKLSQKIVVVAVGGTALTLLGIKESTRDVDFCLSGKDYLHFKEHSGSKLFVVDLFRDGYIFTLQLPDDYAQQAQIIDFKGKNIVIKALSLEDIIITKTARFHSRDIEDIQSVINTGKVRMDRLRQRFKQALDTYAGNENEYQRHFALVLSMVNSFS